MTGPGRVGARLLGLAATAGLLAVTGSAPAVAEPVRKAPAVAGPARETLAGAGSTGGPLAGPAPGSTAGPAAGLGEDGADALGSCAEMARRLREQHSEPGVIHQVVCVDLDRTPPPPPPVDPASIPVPVATGDHPGCVTGPDRPVVGTTLTTARATSPTGKPIVYEYQGLDGGDPVRTGGADDLVFQPAALVPGRSYRWRARAEVPLELLPEQDERGWSGWCEFTVSPDAVDWGRLGDDVSVEDVQALGVRPDRTYAVSLTARQQRLLREGADVRRTAPRMTLSGARWAGLVGRLRESAFVASEVESELGEDYTGVPGGDYDGLADAITAQLRDAPP